MSGLVFPTLGDLAQGIRNLFAQVVGPDVANNAHILTRTYARGISWVLVVSGTLLSNTANAVAPISGVKVSAQLQLVNPDDGSLTNVIQFVGGPSDANGRIMFSDSSGQYDLSQAYVLAIQAVFPDGSASSTTVPFWAGASSKANWGQGLTVNWITKYAVGTPPATQGISIAVSPTSGTGSVTCSGWATPWKPAKGQSFLWYFMDNSVSPPRYARLSSVQGFSFTTFTFSTTIYCVMTDTDGTTYTSASVAITVH